MKRVIVEIIWTYPADDKEAAKRVQDAELDVAAFARERGSVKQNFYVEDRCEKCDGRVAI